MSDFQQHSLSLLLSINKLNELFKRADTESNKLKNDLDYLLENSYTKINIKNDYTQETPGIQSPTCSIYIGFYRKNSNILICHFSIHFDPYCKTSKGRYHIQNNINKQRCHTMKINIKDSQFSLNIIQSPQIMRDEVKKCSFVLETVLRQYLSNNSDLSLSKQLTQITTTHQCVDKVLKVLRKGKSKINKTRKRYTYKNSIKQTK